MSRRPEDPSRRRNHGRRGERRRDNVPRDAGRHDQAPRDATASAEPAVKNWSYGIRAVESLLARRPERVVELWVQSGGEGGPRERIRQTAQEHHLSVRDVEADNLVRLLGEDANHQGVAARTIPFEYADPNALLAAPGPQCILLLDGVQDPHNFGAILRTAVGLGVSAVVIPSHRAVGVTPAVHKVSTGAADQIPIARVKNLVPFMESAKEAGYWCYGTVVEDGEAITSVSFPEKTLLVMGSEGSGMRPLVRRHCDALLSLPLEGVESLNVSVACGIFLYAWRMQRAQASSGA